MLCGLRQALGSSATTCPTALHTSSLSPLRLHSSRTPRLETPVFAFVPHQELGAVSLLDVSWLRAGDGLELFPGSLGHLPECF